MRPVNALRLLCAVTILLGLAAPFARAKSQPQPDRTAAHAASVENSSLGN